MDLLPPEQLQAVFNGIEDNIRRRFKAVLSKAKITNNGSAQHGYIILLYMPPYVYFKHTKLFLAGWLILS